MGHTLHFSKDKNERNGWKTECVMQYPGNMLLDVHKSTDDAT